MQWFNLLATRTRRLSLFQQNPLGSKTRNVFIFPAMVAALIIAWSVSSECLWAVTNSSEQFLLLHPLVPKGSFDTWS